MASITVFGFVIIGGIVTGLSIQTVSECINNNNSFYNKMKKYVKRKRLVNTKKINSEEICVICFDDFTDKNRHSCSTLRGCNHKYHTKCLKKWLKERLVCPQCNINLDK